MQPAKSYQDLVVWQKAHALVLDVYRLTEAFPKSELYGLTSQIRRASVSIAANIAEGFRKRGSADKIRFMNISQGSADEVGYYLILAQDLGYTQTQTLRSKHDEVCRLLQAYIEGIVRRSSSNSK